MNKKSTPSFAPMLSALSTTLLFGAASLLIACSSVRTEGRCDDDSDCGADEACEGICVPACQTDADCATEFGEICRPGIETSRKVCACCASNGSIGPCGDVTVAGECVDSTTMRYCKYEEELIEVDCRESMEAFGAFPTEELHCVETPGGGAECAAPEGLPCDRNDEGWEICHQLYEPASNAPQSRGCYLGGAVYCSGDAAACVWSSSAEATCQVAFDSPPCDPESFEQYCVADTLVHDCHVNQPRATDCAAVGGGVCDPAVGCVMPMGAPCNNVRAVCADGMTCVGGDEHGSVWGSCG